MVVTQRLRQEGPVVSRIFFKVKPKEGAGYRVCFQVPRDDVYDVGLVDRDGVLVKTLTTDTPLNGDLSLDKSSANCYGWDGVSDSGAPAPAGNYRLQLTLESDGRSVVSGERLHVTTEAEPR
jgi:flagellar hook assembly protein FlgD